MLTHVVLFKLKSSATTEETVARLRSLAGNVPMLRGLKVGSDVVCSERSYDVALIARFDSLADLEAYQSHPYHQKVLAYMREVVDRSVAVDFEG